MPGPAPKRSENRLRKNKLEGPELIKGEAGPEIMWPDPNPDWVEVAKRMYSAAQTSGQVAFYEQTDVETLVMWLDAMSLQFKRREGPSAAFWQGWNAGTEPLLLTEGNRRRARIELVRNDTDSVEIGLKRAVANHYEEAAGS